jgi:hypothetical protein
MTTIPTSTVTLSNAATDGFDRVLLRTAATLSSYVVLRLERRSGAAPRRAVAAQSAAASARNAAQARGAIGILPR